MITEDEKYQRAKERVQRLRSFYKNCIIFVFVNILLLILNLAIDPGNLWFYWVTIIWGIVLLVQAFNTFAVKDQFFGEEWEQRKIDEFLDKEKHKKNSSKD